MAFANNTIALKPRSKGSAPKGDKSIARNRAKRARYLAGTANPAAWCRHHGETKAPKGLKKRELPPAVIWDNQIVTGYQAGWLKELAQRKLAPAKGARFQENMMVLQKNLGKLLEAYKGQEALVEAFEVGEEVSVRQEAWIRLVKGALYGRFHKEKQVKDWGALRGGKKKNPKRGDLTPKRGVKVKSSAQEKAEARLKAFKAQRHLARLGQGKGTKVGIFDTRQAPSVWIYTDPTGAKRIPLWGPGAAHESELPGMNEVEPATVVQKEDKLELKKSTRGLINHLGAMGFMIESGDYKYTGGVVTLPSEAYLPKLCWGLVWDIAKESGKTDKLDRTLSKSIKEQKGLGVLDAMDAINRINSPFEDVPKMVRLAEEKGMKVVSIGAKLVGGYIPEYKQVKDLIDDRANAGKYLVITHKINEKLEELGFPQVTVNQLVEELVFENGKLITRPGDLISLFPVSRKARVEDGKLIANWNDRNQKLELVIGFGEDPEKLESGEPIAGGPVWTINDKVINPHQVINGAVVSPEVVLYALIAQISATEKVKTVEGILNVKAVSCFRQEFYNYAVYDDAMKVVCADKVGMLKLEALDRRNIARPSMTDTGSTLDFQMAAKAFMERGMISVPDSQIKALYAARAARLKGLALVGDVVHSMNDASKPNKFFNRPSLNVQQQAGIYNEELEKDGLSLVDGVVRRGVKIHTMITNLVINPGEGVSWVREDFNKVLNLKKTITVILPNLQDAGDSGDFKKRLMSDLAVGPDALVLAEAIMGADIPVLVAGKPAVWYKGEVLKVMDRTELLMSRKVVDIKLEVDPDGRNASLRLETDVSWNESQLKLRGANVKTTLWPGVVEFDSGREQPELLLGVSGYKMDGNQLPVLSMMANTNEGFSYDLAGGLTEEQALALKEFKATNGSQEWITIRGLSYELWDALRNDKGNCPEFEFPEPGVARQLTSILEGYMVLSVEVSTVREAFGTQGLTGEFISSLICEIPELREKIVANMDRSVPGAIAMITGSGEDIYSVMSRGLIDNETKIDLSEVSGKDPYKAFLAYMDGLFPGGLTVLYDIEPEIKLTEAQEKDHYVSCHLDFKALARWESSKSKCASAAIELIKLLGNEDMAEKDWRKMMHRQIKMVRSAAKGMISGSMKKSLTRTRNVQFSAKIKPIITSEIGVWEIGLSVKTAKLMGVEDGDKIVLSRSPMVSFVILSVRVGNFPTALPVVNAVTWAAANEGDGDGDGCAMLVLKKLGVDMTNVRALEINKSLSATGGYAYMYGDMHDKFVKEFMATADLVKKDPLAERKGETKINHQLYLDTIANVGNHYKFFVGATFAMASAITFWYEISETVKKNLAVIADLDLDSLTEDQMVALALYMDKAPSLVRDESLAKARVVVWRGLYEGQALSGWTTPASQLAATLSTVGAKNFMFVGPSLEDLKDPEIMAAKNQEVLDFETMIRGTELAPLVASGKRTHASGESYYFIGHSSEELNGGVTWDQVLEVQALLVAIACRRAGLFVELDAAKHIGEANILRKLYGFIERKSTTPVAKAFNLGIASNFTQVAGRAIAVGTLRRTGGGMTHNEMLDLENSETLVSLLDLDTLKAEFGMVDDCLLELGFTNPLCGEIMAQAHPSLVAIDEFMRGELAKQNNSFGF